jgi:hypothetical protein
MASLGRFARWWDAQPDGPYRCADCGRVGPKAYVQPQQGMGIALCSECIAHRNQQRREERKRELAGMPRCVQRWWDGPVRAPSTPAGGSGVPGFRGIVGWAGAA